VTRRALESAGVEFIDENRGPRRPRRSDRYSAACARASLGFIDENGGSPASVLVANNKRLFTARRLSALFWQNEPKIFMHFAALAYAGGGIGHGAGRGIADHCGNEMCPYVNRNLDALGGLMQS